MQFSRLSIEPYFIIILQAAMRPFFQPVADYTMIRQQKYVSNTRNEFEDMRL